MPLQSKFSDGRESSRQVILVGASVRSAAQSASKAGLLVIGVDKFGDEDTRAACMQMHCFQRGDELDRILRRYPGVPVIQVGGLATGDTGHYFRAETDPTMALRDPAVLRQAAENSGFQFPVTIDLSLQHSARPRANSSLPLINPRRAASRGEETGEGNDENCEIAFKRFRDQPSWEQPTLDNRFGRPSPIRWLRKSLNSCGGLGIRWFDSPGGGPALPVPESGTFDVEKFSSWRPGLPEGDVIQQWVAGRSCGATLISDGADAVVLGVCRSMFRRGGSHPFVYAGSFGPVPMPPQTESCLTRLGKQLVGRTGIRALFNIDFLVDRSGRLWLLEVNPRWSGSSELIERNLEDRGLIDETTTLFSLTQDVGDRKVTAQSIRTMLQYLGPTPKRYFKRFLFAPNKLRFSPPKFAELIDDTTTLHDIPAANTVLLPGEPVCTLIFRFDVDEQKPMRRVSRRFRACRDLLHHCIQT